MYDINRTMKEIEKMKKGGVGEISIAELVPQFVSLSAAKGNLSDEEFERFYEFYSTFEENHEIMEVDYDEYFDIGIDVLAAFNAIAPAELYCRDDNYLDMLDAYLAEMADEEQEQLEYYVYTFTDFFESQDIDYDVVNDNMLLYKLELDNELDSAFCRIAIDEGFIFVYTHIDWVAAPDKKNELLDFFNGENQIDAIGDFHINAASGKIIYAIKSCLLDVEEIPFYYIPMFVFHGASRFNAIGDIIADMVVPAEE